MTPKTPHKKTAPRLFNLLIDLLIDIGLIGLGYAIYYHFMIQAFGPFDFHPIVYSILGSRDTAVLIIAGLPFVVGLFSLARTLWRFFKRTNPAKS